jgi:sterol desaturase/sphingolipid hydroxylase (fatty acid hydroxylase superfamily)
VARSNPIVVILTALVVFAGVIAFIAACAALPAWLVMLAWNYVGPIWWAGAPHLTFWPTWVTMFLLGIVVRYASRLFAPSVVVTRTITINRRF